MQSTTDLQTAAQRFQQTLNESPNMEWATLSNAPRAAGHTDMSLPGTLDPAVAVLGGAANALADTSSPLESTQAAQKEIMRRHAQLKERRVQQLNTAKSMATTLAGATQAHVPSAVAPLGSSAVDSHASQAHVSVPTHQVWGVLTVCNRKRPPVSSEPCFILEGAFETLDAARQYMDCALQTPGYVGAPMAVQMRHYELLAVSRDRQADDGRKAKVERLLSRHYLEQEVKAREHSQNVMQKKAGRVGMSRNFDEMRQKAQRERAKEGVLRKAVKRQAARRARLLKMAQAERDQTSVRIEELGDGVDLAADASVSEDRGSHHEDGIEQGNDEEHEQAEAEVRALAEEEQAKLQREMRELGASRRIDFTYPQTLKREGQAFAAISIVDDTDKFKDEKGDRDAVGNEPVLIWYGSFADAETAEACIKSGISEISDAAAIDCVPMYVPLFPKSIDLDQVREHYKDPEQEAISAFRKSQKHAHAKFEELCEGIELPFVDLGGIDMSPLEREQIWRIERNRCVEKDQPIPPLPLPLVEYYASVFKNGGILPEDVKEQLMLGNVEKTVVEKMKEERESRTVP